MADVHQSNDDGVVKGVVKFIGTEKTGDGGGEGEECYMGKDSNNK